MENTITEMKNTLERINSRWGDIERISDLENRITEIRRAKTTKKLMRT